MARSKDSFLDRLFGKIDTMDSKSIQTYIHRLSKEKGFLETVFNTIREGIIVVDRRLNINYYNDAAEELLGLPENMENVRISQFLRDVDWKKILVEDEEEWYRVSRQELEVLYPVRRILHFYLVPNEGGRESATIILNDVTESRNRTLDLIESEKIQIISTLAAEVAHEIGNPLNSIYLHLQLLQRHFAEEKIDRDEVNELLGVAKGEVERLDTLITQFLSAIRPSKPEMEAVRIKDLIVESLTFMRSEIENRKVDVKCSWPDLLPIVSGDPKQLKQAFYNIIKNAVQAMPEGGKLGVNCIFDDDCLELSFDDSGVGINPEDLGDIFEPYHSSKETGTGLGLLIVERVIREHGAELVLDSNPGKGTTITIKFPRHRRRIRFLPEPEADKVVEVLNVKPV